MKVAVIGRGFGSSGMKPAYEARGWEVTVVPARDDAAVAEICAMDFDLVSVHSPPFRHRDHVLRAVESGKHVLCDKPFGVNGAQAREMRDAANNAGVLHFLNFEFRFQPALAKAKQLLDEKAIGELRHISMTCHAGYMVGRPHGWLNEAKLGGGWIGAWGSHQIDAIRWLTEAECASCRAESRIDVRERLRGDGTSVLATAEDAFTATLVMENGVTAMIDAAFALPANRPARTQLLGTGGAIEIVNNAAVMVYTESKKEQTFDYPIDSQGNVRPAIYQWIGMIEVALDERRQVAPNFDDGLATAEVMDRFRAGSSHAGGSSPRSGIAS